MFIFINTRQFSIDFSIHSMSSWWSSIDIVFNQTEYKLSQTASVDVTAPNSNTNDSVAEDITVGVTSTEDPGGISITASEY